MTHPMDILTSIHPSMIRRKGTEVNPHRKERESVEQQRFRELFVSGSHHPLDGTFFPIEKFL